MRCVYRVRLMLVKTASVQQPRLARSCWSLSTMQLRKWKKRFVKMLSYFCCIWYHSCFWSV